ncbi:phage major tail tube protein [Methylobacterium oryzihabitans]|uniref:Phage tail protein n=1 Tax=Methylobacterium oryzihabitans TaxID=2499852 RepID=A0A3S2W426_9HYPH|nr:phage major tail tube protein [Methylobacterium oryzihabitans]RVU13171.1 phage tail protein [Methylobacterium oryzihabitans]
MAQDILIIEEVDVRRADDPDDTRVLTVTKVGLPEIKRKEAEHTPGGGVGSVKFLLPMADSIEPKFSVKGLDLDVLRKYGFSAGQHDKWTFAASLRNKRTNKLVSVRSTIQGIVSTWSPGEHTPGELLDCDHTLAEVTYYDLVINGEEIFAWSFYGRYWRSGGIDLFAEYRNALGA